MILFKEDWDNYPSATVDLTTSNKSFIRLSGLYKKMGIDNNTFLLSLIDQDLIGVDPHDENLSNEMIAKIVLECKLNFWYYLREVAMIPSSSGADGIKFKANRGNIATCWLFFNHITAVVIQIRQTGKSVTNDIIVDWLLKIGAVNTEINLLTKDRTLRQKNIFRVKEMGELLPYYLQLKNKNDIINTEMLRGEELGNSFIGHVPRSSVRDAIKVGRGMTSAIAIIDEGPFQPNIEISVPAALAAGGAARDLAKERGEPYGTLFTTTAGSLSNKSGVYIHNLLTNSSQWSEKMFDSKDKKELEKIIRANSPKGKLRVGIEFNHRQLGYTDEWLKSKIDELEADTSDPSDILSDMFNVWSTSGLTSPLGKMSLREIKESIIDPLYTEITDYSYLMKWYLSESIVENHLRNTEMVLGVDTSDGAGDDAIAMHFRNASTGDTIGTAVINETNLITYAEWLFSLLNKYQKMLLAIERRSSGVMIIDYLLKMFSSTGVNPFTRIFNWVVQEFEENPEAFKEASNNSRNNVCIKYKKEFGYATSGSGRASRDNLYGTALRGALKYTASGVRDITLSGQLTGLIIKNGRIDHPDGGNDDLCIAWLLSYWVLTNGRNLKYYGINPVLVLSEIRKSVTNKSSPTEVYDNRHQILLRKNINSLSTQLKNTRDDYMATILEKQIRALSTDIKLLDNEKFNVDTLVEELNNRRKN